MLFKTITVASALTMLHADAQANHYTAMGATCFPQETSLTNLNYQIVNGYVTHNGSADDLITLYCPVSPNISAPAHLSLLYRDNDAANTTYVSATLVRIDKFTGAATVAATATSEDGNETGAYSYVTKNFVLPHPQNTSFYYVEVSIDRSSAARSAAFYGIVLW